MRWKMTCSLCRGVVDGDQSPSLLSLVRVVALPYNN